MVVTQMDEQTRIQKDVVMFEQNREQIAKKHLSSRELKILELATQYYQDAQYYLKKNDLFTAFGCINYAHGLLDAILKDF